MNGGTLLIRTSDWKYVLKRAHTIVSTPSILGTFPREEYPNIKIIALAGEPCPKSLADEWSKQATFFNCCGPTEVTIVNTMHRHSSGGELSIGRPVPNTNVYILDENEKPAAIGQTGLMWVGGAAVSKGYLNLPELTAARYKYDKFLNDGSMMFNTGDLCRWQPDGSIAHEGRADDQVKIKGFRVELDSVSASIESAPGITKACAIFNDKVLWGFYSGVEYDEAKIKSIMDKRQAYYAIPSKFVYRQELPMTSNGKIDKMALLASVGVTSSALPNSILAPSKPTSSHERTISAATTIASVHPGTRIIQRPLPVLTASIVTITPATNIRPAIPNTKAAGLRRETRYTQQPWHLLPPLEKQPMQAPLNLPSRSSSMSSSNTYLEKYQLPKKIGRHGLRAFRHRILSLYRRLFSIVFVINLIALIFMLKFGREGRGLENVSVAIGANLATAVLMRQEIVINALFNTACSIPTSAPMWLRRNCAKVYHIGGLHSGCAVASTFWLILFTIVATVEYRDPAVLVISYLLILLLVGMVFSAHPTIRIKYHDHFELIHRFAGWSALILFWIQTVVVTNSFRGLQPLSQALVINPAFWLLLIATLSVILPWLNLRKVTVRADVLSPHAVRLYFTYTTPVVGTAIRLSERPLLEWHAFATIAKPNSNEFSVLVSNAGDWTKTSNHPSSN